jgi:hypothetical protein
MAAMDINEAHYNMGHMGEGALRRFLNCHNIKATGKFQNCVGCMKWEAQNKAVSKVATNSAKYLGQRVQNWCKWNTSATNGKKRILVED